MKAHPDAFPIVAISCWDLAMLGYDILGVDDAKMREVARRMRKACWKPDFWLELPIVLDQLGIRKCEAK